MITSAVIKVLRKPSTMVCRCYKFSKLTDAVHAGQQALALGLSPTFLKGFSLISEEAECPSNMALFPSILEVIISGDQRIVEAEVKAIDLLMGKKGEMS